MSVIYIFNTFSCWYEKKSTKFQWLQQLAQTFDPTTLPQINEKKNRRKTDIRQYQGPSIQLTNRQSIALGVIAKICGSLVYGQRTPKSRVQCLV